MMKQLLIASVMCLIGSTSVIGDTLPRKSLTLPEVLPEDAVVLKAVPPPPDLGFTPASSPVSPNPSLSFFSYSDTNPVANPPDTQGAVGPSHVVTMINGFIRIQDRSSNVISTTSLSNWWGFVVDYQSPFDPRILYDPYQNRWIAAALANRDSSTSAVLIAASSDSYPTGTWHRFMFKADAAGTNDADFTMLGFNKDWVAVTANMFITGTSNHFARVWAFNKTNLYAGGTNHTVFTDTNKAATLAPALTYDNTLSRLYLLTAYMITGAVTSPKLVATASFLTITNALGGWADKSTSGDFGGQLGSSTYIDLGDSQFTAPIIYRNGSLWCVHMVYLPKTGATERAAIQWWHFRAGPSR